MLEKPDVRRIGGLTTLFLGLTAVFASLTLVAVSRPGLAGAFAIAGAGLAFAGLRWLRRLSS